MIAVIVKCLLLPNAGKLLWEYNREIFAVFFGQLLCNSNGLSVGGQDYDSIDRSVVFSGSRLSEQVIINTNSDDLLEQPESFSISLSHSEGNKVLLLPSQSTVWIMDNNGMLVDNFFSVNFGFDKAS